MNGEAEGRMKKGEVLFFSGELMRNSLSLSPLSISLSLSVSLLQGATKAGFHAVKRDCVIFSLATTTHHEMLHKDIRGHLVLCEIN